MSVPATASPSVIAEMFAAPSVAIVGISARREDGWGRAVLKTLRSGGYQGDVWAVHPHAQIEGVDTYASFAELPAAPGLVAVCVPADRVIEVIRSASERGATGAVVFSSGFAEHSDKGSDLQDQLLEAANGMPLVGPNCVGITNFHDKLCLTAVTALAHFTDDPGDVAIVTQSGAIGAVIAERLRQVGVGISHFASIGNASMLTGPMLAESLLNDPRVRILVGYIESASESADWAAVGDLAAQQGKHVVLLVIGRTSASRVAAVSHTAAASGDALLFAGAVRARGVHIAIDEDEIADLVVSLRHGHALPNAARVAIVTNSGGAGAILLDKLADIDSEPAHLSPTTTEAMRDMGVFEASIANPIDIGGNWEQALPKIPELLRVLSNDENVDAIVTYFPFGIGQETPLRAIPAAAKELPTPFVHIWAAAPEGAMRNFGAADLVVDSIAAAVRRLSAMKKGASLPRGAARSHPQPTVALDLTTMAHTIPESDAAAILRSLGADVVTSHVIEQSADYAASVGALGSGPWVVKGESARIPHRASAGLVALGVAGVDLATTVAATFRRLQECEAGPDARVVIQPQVAYTAVVSVGALRDEHHGPVVVVGPGGSQAEARDSRRQALGLPASDEALLAFATDTARDFGIEPRPLMRMVSAVTHCLLSDERVRAVEVNPAVRVNAEQLIAVDALIDLAPPPEKTP